MKLQSASAWRANLLLTTLIGMHSAMADNTPNQANQIGTDPANFVGTDMVGSTDTMDYYKFTLTSKRSVNVALTGLSGDADLYLQGSNGTYLFSAKRGNGVSESIRKNLDPGQYQIMVYGWTGSVNYRLQVATVSSNPPPGRARTLGPLDGMNGRNGTVNASGTIAPTTGWIDYRFALPGDRQIQIRGQGNVAAGVTPATGVSRWKMVQNNQLHTTLGAGNYYLRVFRNPARAESFSFAITAKPINTNDTAGHNTRTARNLGRIGNPPTKVNEYVGEHDFDDFYRVNVNANSVLNVALTHRYGSNADVFVYDPLGRRIAQSRNAGSANESISANALQGGIYYVQVGIAGRQGPKWQNAGYTVNIGTVPASQSVPRPATPQPAPSTSSEPRNNRSGGADLFARGQLSPTSFTQPGTVGGSDGQDWYQFRVPCIPDTSTQFARGPQIPSFSLVPGAGVNVTLFQVLNNGSQRRLNYTPDQRVRPVYERGRSTYQFRIRVRSSSGQPVQYGISARTRGCFSP